MPQWGICRRQKRGERVNRNEQRPEAPPRGRLRRLRLRSDPFVFSSHPPVPAYSKLHIMLAGFHSWNPLSELRRSERSAVIYPFFLHGMQVKKGYITVIKRAYTSFHIPGIYKKTACFHKRFYWNPAATYSPGPLPVKYHRH